MEVSVSQEGNCSLEGGSQIYKSFPVPNIAEVSVKDKGRNCLVLNDTTGFSLGHYSIIDQHQNFEFTWALPRSRPLGWNSHVNHLITGEVIPGNGGREVRV